MSGFHCGGVKTKGVLGIVFLADSTQSTLYFINGGVKMHGGSLESSEAVEFQHKSYMRSLDLSVKEGV